MASAEVIRQFATAQFRREALRRQFEPHNHRTVTEMLSEVGERIEDLGWLAAGARLGYFEPTDLRLDERESALITRIITSPEAMSWPASFRALATSFISEAGLTRGELQWREPSNEDLADARALFQALMITAEGFRDPLIRFLQGSLITQHSILDSKPEPIYPEQVFDVFRDFSSEPTLAHAVAGLIDLMDVIAAIEHIFTSVREGSAVWAVKGEVSPLLAWHLNLEDDRLVRRLKVVSLAFWDIAKAEFSRQSELRWQQEESRLLWQKLLVNWRDRFVAGESGHSHISDFLW